MSIKHLTEWELAGETELFEGNTWLSAILSTTNPTWSDIGHRGAKPLTAWTMTRPLRMVRK
jgi:hypothetical protein